MSVSVCVCVCHCDLHWGRGGGGSIQLLCQLPVTQCRPNQIDRDRHTARGPKFPIPFPPIHQSVCVNSFLASVCCLCISLSCSVCLSFTLSHTLISANLCNVHSNSKYALRLSRMLCFMCYESNQIACSSLHTLQPPAVDVDITIKMLSFCNHAL